MAARTRRASRVTREAIRERTGPVGAIDVSPEPAPAPEPKAAEKTTATKQTTTTSTEKTTAKKAT